MTVAPDERDVLRLVHILNAVDGLRNVVGVKPVEQLKKDWASARAIERGFEIISEASRHLSDDLKAREADIPWRAIAGIGNILRHDYDGVEMAVLMKTYHKDLDALEAALRRQYERLVPTK